MMPSQRPDLAQRLNRWKVLFLPVAEPLGQVAPASPRPSDPEHGVDEKSVVLCGDAGGGGPPGEEKFDANPLLIRHLKSASHDDPPWVVGPPHVTRITQAKRSDCQHYLVLLR